MHARAGLGRCPSKAGRIVWVLLLLAFLPAAAQGNGKPVEEQLDAALAGIDKQVAAIAKLEQQAAAAEGLVQLALTARLDDAWSTLLEDRLAFLTAVADHQDTGADIARYRARAERLLTSQAEVARSVAQRLAGRVEFPAPDLPPAERAAAQARVIAALHTYLGAYATMDDTLEVAERFGVDLSADEAWLRAELERLAANISILLQVAQEKEDNLDAGLEVLPDDAALQAEDRLAEGLVRQMAGVLGSAAELMDGLEMETAAYKEQVLAVTGELSTGLFDLAVFRALIGTWWDAIVGAVSENGPDLFFKALLFLIILWVARRVSRLAAKVAERALVQSNLKTSELLRRMVLSVTRNVVFGIGILIALSQVGLSLGPLLAGLGVAGFVIGFALQDSLSNFASGMMILIYRPFDVGDLVEVGGVFGTVSSMSLVNTTILTLDNQTLILPNNKIWGDVIKNVTAQKVRRVDMMFGISYTDDIPKTEKVLEEIIASSKYALKDPEPMIHLHELGDSSVNFVVRPWVNTDDYWDAYWEVTRAVKMRFDEEGISIPFPQRDVHLYTEAGEPPAGLSRESAAGT
jgi:small conductance mechanosensitive channel